MSDMQSKTHFTIELDGRDIESLVSGFDVEVESETFVATVEAGDVTASQHRQIAHKAVRGLAEAEQQ